MSLPNPGIWFFSEDGAVDWIPSGEWVSFSFTAGRQNVLDTYGAATGELVFRRTASNEADLAAIKPGWSARIYDEPTLSGSSPIIGYVYDVVNQYSIASNADFTVINIEGGLGPLNRVELNSYSLASDTIGNQIETLSAYIDFPLGSDFAILSDPDMDGTTITSPADWLQKAMLTVNGRLDDSGAGVTALDKFGSYSFADLVNGDTIVFTDGSLALSVGEVGIAFDQVDFSSLSQNYYTRAIVDPDGHAAQVNTAPGAITPYRVISLATFNKNTAQAADFAEYLVNTFSDPQYRPAMVSVNGQDGNANDLLLPSLAGNCIGRTVRIILRGEAYDAVIEGWAVTADPSSSRFTFYVSGADLNAYLILDDTNRGVLDANRLGY